MASSLESTSTPLPYIQHERFTTKQSGYQLWDLSLDSSGNIAVSGDHLDGRTFIDLYFGYSSDSKDKLKPFNSIEFKKYAGYSLRLVAFLETNCSKIVTCIGDKTEILETKKKSEVLQSFKVNGNTRCLAVREGEIFIGIENSQTVVVIKNGSTKRKKISLTGIEDGDYPREMQVIKDTIFVCTAHPHYRALSIAKSNGNIVTEYTNITGKYNYNAYSITVSEELSLVAVLWGDNFMGENRVIVYTLKENRYLLVFDVDYAVGKIRISDKDRMVITGNTETGAIKMYDLDRFMSFSAMRRTLAYIVSPDECEKLSKYFEITEEEISRKVEASKDQSKCSHHDKDQTLYKVECLLTIIGEKGYLDPWNINHLKAAVSSLGDDMRAFHLKGPMEGYIAHGVPTLHRTIYEELGTEVKILQDAWRDERHRLHVKLETVSKKIEDITAEHEKTIEGLNDELRRMKKTYEDQERKKEKKGSTKQEFVAKRGVSNRETQNLTKELEETQQSLDLSSIESTKMTTRLNEELEQAKVIQNLKEQLHQINQKLQKQKQESYQEIKRLNEQLDKANQSLELRRQESRKPVVAPRKDKLQRQMQSTAEIETLRKELERTMQVLNKTKEDRDDTRSELKEYQFNFAKESNALKEVLNQTKQTMGELQKRTIENKSSIDSEKYGDDVQILAAKYGRFTVSIAEHLTLDHCLKLARIFDIPASDCDLVRRLSLIESPGMKFLDVLKKRNVINMFDVTNLQKGLAMLHLETVNNDLITPYQESIDDDQYELYKVEEMFTWEEIGAFVNYAKDISPKRQMRDSQTSPEDDTGPGNPSQRDAGETHSETGVVDGGSILRKRHHQLYIEQHIGKEGGTINLVNVTLTIPADALPESQVIALTVMNESPFPLDREVDTARLTPLIKLEPLGLVFKKSLKLNIPHCALIPDPDNHDVIIYSGEVSKNNKDSSECVKWTKEKSLPRQLKEKLLIIDINRLSYLSASLVSHATATPLYILRAVPFVDGVRHADDDITLTICFCSDNVSAYNMLLSDYQTKLPLEQYSTLLLRRHSEKDEDYAGFLSVTVTSVSNSYVPDAEQAVKSFAISHLCAASRVSHQLRLKKNHDTEKDAVDIVLTFSQAQYETTKILLKARIKDLMVSQESEDLLAGSSFADIQPYEELKANISSMLEKLHCRHLAAYFELSPAEEDRVENGSSPGRMLIKILDEREKIMPQKMIGLFQGLKACHLDKIARLVTEYMENNADQTRQETQQYKGNKTKEIARAIPASDAQLKTHEIPVRSRHSYQLVQTTVSSSRVSPDVHDGRLNDIEKALENVKNRLLSTGTALQYLEGLLGKQ